MERRMYPRYQIDLPVKLETKDPQNIHRSGEIVDISLGGAGLSLDTCIPLDTRVALQTDPSSEKPALSTEARVKWTQHVPSGNQFRHGLEFSEPDTDYIKNVICQINIEKIESFFECSLPDHIKSNFSETWISKKLNQKEIMEVIDFEPPFLKVDKTIIFDTYSNDNITPNKCLSMGMVRLDDTRGHYNDTMFLALCGWLMASSASIHLAALAPKTVPQVIEAVGVRPMLSLDNRKHVWKPAKDGTRFFVESHILKQKLRLAIVTTTITFSNILFGVVDELKLIIDSRESIFNAVEFPSWR